MGMIVVNESGDRWLVMWHGSEVHSGWLAREESVSFYSRQSISDYVIRTMYVPDGGGELRDIV